jgi:hypothetical protein
VEGEAIRAGHVSGLIRRKFDKDQAPAQWAVDLVRPGIDAGTFTRDRNKAEPFNQLLGVIDRSVELGSRTLGVAAGGVGFGGIFWDYFHFLGLFGLVSLTGDKKNLIYPH